jgi:hypothetical protein
MIDRHLVVDPRRLTTGAAAGFVAAAAFAAWMKLDMRVTGKRLDDFQLLGGIGPLSEHWPVTGAAIHHVNGALLGAGYTTLEPVLPGPGWFRGLLFALTENAVLWPIILVLDRVHPAIRSGELPSYNRPMPFLVETLRHVVYGAVLGYVFERLNRRTS